MKLRKALLVLIAIALLFATALYAGKSVILNKFKSLLIEKIESSTKKGVKIGRIGYVPVRGIRLGDIRLYSDRFYREEACSISSADIKFPLFSLIAKRVFSPTITLRDFRLKEVSAGGTLAFSVKLGAKISRPRDILNAVHGLNFRGFSVRNRFLDIENLNGSVSISPELIETSDFNFTLNGESYNVDLEVREPAGELSATLDVTATHPDLVSFNLTSSVKKEGDTYKIRRIKGSARDSSFDFTGNLSAEGAGGNRSPVLSLDGRAVIDIKDIVYLVPPEFKKSVAEMGIEGKIVVSSAYFKGDLRDASGWEMVVKSDADYLKFGDFQLDKFHAEVIVKDGFLTTPIIIAYPYNGVLTASITANLADKGIPYEAGYKLNNIDISALLRNTALGSKNIRGVLFSNVGVKGYAKDINSMTGSGRISVGRANLGPMPLLTPLLGNLYGYLQHTFSGLKKIEITGGSCDFYIANRKLMTDNLTLTGEIITIKARGYIDFDTNLRFEVENEIAGPEEVDTPDWQASIQQMIASIGKVMSKAYLSGTLKDPKWKFEYLGGMEEMFKGGLDQFLKGIFEE